MQSGIVSLKSLYDYAEADPECKALAGQNSESNEYASHVRAIINSIPENSGFVLCGHYNPNQAWVSVYLGSSESSLKEYIGERLRDDKVFIYRCFQQERELLKKCDQYYQCRYWRNWLNAIQMFWSTTHIVWYETSDSSDNNLKATLIETFNPSGNTKRPAPGLPMGEDTAKIVLAISNIIHSERTLGFSSHFQSILIRLP